MKKRELLKQFEKRLIFTQLAVIFILLSIILLMFSWWGNRQALSQLIKSREYSVSRLVESVDSLFDSAIILLEKPYTNTEIYRILNNDYTVTSEYNKETDSAKMLSHLYTDFLYYYPFISSIILVPENRSEPYFKISYPITLNVNSNLADVQESLWYTQAIETEDSFIFGPYDDSFFNSDNSKVISFVQRIKNPFTDTRLAVLRIDILLNQLTLDWNLLVTEPADYFYVETPSGDLLYSSDVQYMEKLRRERYIKTQVQSKYGFSFVYLTNSRIPFSHFILPILTATVLAVVYFFLAFAFIVVLSRKISRPIKDDIQQREVEKTKLAYEVLQSKINPHFLYNTLNAIKWKAEVIGAKDLARTLDALADLLKGTIKETRELISVAQDISYLEEYIRIMRLRYGDEIEINYDIEDECLSYLCPKFIVQPLIENCFIHAFCDTHKNEKHIEITMKKMDESLIIRVQDNGRGMTQEQIESLYFEEEKKSSSVFTSIGISSVERRIKNLFGNVYGIRYESLVGSYTKCIILIPLIVEADAEGVTND